MSIPAAQPGPTGGETIASSRATVLVVDDEPALRRLFVTALTRAGYQAFEAENGHAAVGLFDRHAGAIDLLLTDLRMPVMDGPTLIRELRARDPGLRVVCVSGYAGDLPSNPGILFLSKPVSRDTLLAKVKEALL